MILPNFILAQSHQATEMGLDQKIDKAFKPFSDFVSNVVFFEVFNGAPFVIVLLVFSAMFFTLYFGFPNIKYFGTAINVVRGKYDDLDKDENGNKIRTERALYHLVRGQGYYRNPLKFIWSISTKWLRPWKIYMISNIQLN